jgi:hypothetical protein
LGPVFLSVFKETLARQSPVSVTFEWALYFLEPMLFEHGLGTSPRGCDHLASDELKAWLPSPT